MTDLSSNTPQAFVPFLTGADLPDDLIERLCQVIPSPQHAKVDKPAFVRLVGTSMSLSATEKLRVFESMATLSQFQFDELTVVLNDEVIEFKKLVPTEWMFIAPLTARSWLHLCMVADHLGAGYVDDTAERMVLSGMLARKFCGDEEQFWLSRFMGLSPLVDHVFSAIDTSSDVGQGQLQLELVPEVF